MLREWGVDDIVVNCHYHADQIEAWCRANGCATSREEEILGTGGVLNPLREWIGEESFYLVNGDIVLEGAKPLELPQDDSAIGCCLVAKEGPRTIEVEPLSRFVTNWRSDDAGADGTFTYCGVALLRSGVLDFVAPAGFSSIVSAYEKAMMAGRFVQAVAPDDLLWADAGTIDSYIDLNRDGDDNAFADIPPLRAVGASPATEFLGARGSERVFFREGERVIIVYDDAKRRENARYAGHARWLRAKGVSVPAVLDDRPEWKTLVMEHIGSAREMTLEDYVKVVEALVGFNALSAAHDIPELEDAFGADVWKWERELFAEHCLGARYRMPLPGDVRAELVKVEAVLGAEPRALVHRDFQSTNVLWKGERFGFIDFQGMRLGPAAYDLASLVYDPYAKLAKGERRALVALYAKKAGREEIAKVVPFAAVQRLVQCLGAYGRLASVGQTQFLKFVAPALANLAEAATAAGLDAVKALAEELIAREAPHHHHHHHG